MSLDQQEHENDEITTTQDDIAEQPAADAPDATQGEQDAPKEPQQDDKPKEVKPEPTPAEKEAKALRRRVDRLTRRYYEAEARQQQLEHELAQYRAPQQAQEFGQEGDSQQHARPPQQQFTQADVQRQAQEMVEMQRIGARCDEVVSKGEAEHPDFGQKVLELGAELPLFDQRTGRHQPILEALLDADDPAALIYHLGSNPDVAAEIAELSPRQQVRRLAQIELELQSAPTKRGPPAAPASPPLSKAPPPITPTRGAGGQFTKDPAAMSDAEWWASQRKT